MEPPDRLRIAIVGGGPSALLVFQRLVESGRSDLNVTIFEQHDVLGRGSPYSVAGAGPEHITNVSGNEIPDFEPTLTQWVRTRPTELLDGVDADRFNEDMVLPRLLFGLYLEERFADLRRRELLQSRVVSGRRVTEVRDLRALNELEVELEDGERLRFDRCFVAG